MDDMTDIDGRAEAIAEIRKAVAALCARYPEDLVARGRAGGQSVAEGFECCSSIHQALETKAVHDRAGRSGDVRRDAVNRRSLDACREHRAREADHADACDGGLRGPGAVGDGQPDFWRQRRADAVDLQRGQKADDRARCPGAGGSHGVELGRLSAGEVVQASCDLLDRTSPQEGPEPGSRDPESLEVSRAEVVPEPGPAESRRR